MKLKKFIAVLLSAVFLMMILPVAYASESMTTYTVIDFGSGETEIFSPLKEDREIVRYGTMTGRWDDTTTNKLVEKVLDKNDLSGYTHYNQLVYSKKATNAAVHVIIYSKGGSAVNKYFRYTFNVDWTGWKLLSVPLSDFWRKEDSTWDDVRIFRYRSDGFLGTTADPETSLNIEKIWFSKAKPSEDCNKIVEMWKKSLVGDETNDISETYTKSKINSVNTDATAVLETMNVSDSTLPPWGEKLVESGDMSSQFTNIRTLALAYSTYGADLYGNKDLFDKIIYALDWMYENAYGIDEMANTGWRDTKLHNWYDWQIASPRALVDIMIMLRAELAEEFILKECEVIRHFVPKTKDYGSNLINFAKIMIGSGALSGDTTRIQNAVNALPNEFLFVDGKFDQGFHKDGTYLFHTRHFHNGSYGSSHLLNLTETALLLSGTEYEIEHDKMKNLFSIISGSFEPIIYGTSIMSFAMGRTPKGGRTETKYIVSSIVNTVSLLEDDNKYAAEITKLKSLLKKYLTDNPGFYPALTIDNIKKAKAIVADEGVLPRENYNIGKVYYNGDKVVAQRENYATGVSMSSSRIYNYESINSQNMDGWYIGDGMLYVYTPKNVQYQANWWTGANKYRMPGTTVDSQERVKASIKQKNEYLSSKDFVGGVSLDDTYTTAAMELESFHNDVEGTVVSEGNGADQPLHNSTLTAKKSWFMFDNEIVALGTDIKANDGFDVYTTVDNRKLSSKKVYVDSSSDIYSSLKNDGTANVYNNASWMNLENHIGYVFNNKENITVAKNPSANEFVEAWIDHGVSPSGGDYAYTVLPCSDVSATSAYSKNPETTVLSNTDKLQAVKDASSGVTGAVFWEKGTLDYVTSENPAILMYENDNGIIKMSVSDPTQKQESLTFKVNSDIIIIESDSEIKVENSDGFTTVTVDTSDLSGKSYGFEFIRINDNIKKDGTGALNPVITANSDSVNVDFTIINTKKSSDTVNLIVVLYNKLSGKLENVFSESLTVTENVITEKNIVWPVKTDGLDIKAFVWKSAKTAEPVEIAVN